MREDFQDFYCEKLDAKVLASKMEITTPYGAMEGPGGAVLYMMDYIKDPDIWLSLLAVVISMIALWQTHRQIKLSNKQQLFDRRLSNYLVFEDLLENYRENGERCKLNNNERWLFHAGMALYFLLSASFFEFTSAAEIQPNSTRFIKELSTKRVELRKVSEEISILFEAAISSAACDFISAYEQAVKSSHEFVWAWHDTDTKYRNGMTEELLKERESEKTKLDADLTRLDETFQVLETKKTEQEMKRQIKL